MECFRLLLEHLAWIDHQFLSGIRDLRKAGSLWGMRRGVGGVKKSLNQSWLARRLGLGLLCWSFKGVQEEIPREDAGTLQIGSVAFPPEEYTSPQLHPCYRLFDQDRHQHSSSASPSTDLTPCDFWLFPKLRGCCYEKIEGDETGCDEGHWHVHIRGLPWGLAEVVGTVQQVRCSWRIFLRRGLEFHVCTNNKSTHTKKKIWKLIVCLSYRLSANDL